MNRRNLLKALSAGAIGYFTFKPGKLFALGSTLLDGTTDEFFLISSAPELETQQFHRDISLELNRRFSHSSIGITVIDRTRDSGALHNLKKRVQFDENTLPDLIVLRIPSANKTLIADLETEIEYWTQDWLSYKYRKDYVDTCYPVSDGWWSVEGDFKPTIKKVRKHLFESPNHTGGHFELDYLMLLTFEELQSLHSDHHREMIDQGHVAWEQVNHECPRI